MKLLDLLGRTEPSLPAAGERIRKTDDEVRLWLAQQPLEKAIRSQDTKSIARYHGDEGRAYVDDSLEADQHPPQHSAHVQAFKQAVIENPDPVKRGRTGTRESSNSTGKVVYDVKDQWIGDQRDHRFMVKPYHEKIVPRMRSWIHFPIQGWAEMTNQALYHASGIGDLHQRVHVAPIPIQVKSKPIPENLASLPKEPPEKTVPGLVIHMQPGVTPAGGRIAYPPGFWTPDLKSQARKLAIMDFLSNNLDRHGDNLLVDQANQRLLAVDQSRSFQYKTAKKFGKGPADLREDNLRNYVTYTNDRPVAFHQVLTVPRRGWGTTSADMQAYQDALHQWHDDWRPAFEWWQKFSEPVQKAWEQRLKLIKDPQVQQHLRQNFEARARQLDQYAEFGTENFGSDDWDLAPVPIYKPGETQD